MLDGVFDIDGEEFELPDGERRGMEKRYLKIVVRTRRGWARRLFESPHNSSIQPTVLLTVRSD